MLFSRWQKGAFWVGPHMVLAGSPLAAAPHCHLCGEPATHQWEQATDRGPHVTHVTTWEFSKRKGKLLSRALSNQRCCPSQKETGNQITINVMKFEHQGVTHTLISRWSFAISRIQTSLDLSLNFSGWSCLLFQFSSFSLSFQAIKCNFLLVSNSTTCMSVRLFLIGCFWFGEWGNVTVAGWIVGHPQILKWGSILWDWAMSLLHVAVTQRPSSAVTGTPKIWGLNTDLLGLGEFRYYNSIG